MATKTGDLLKEANLLVGDSIINFKTVQSFGYEDLIVERYKQFLAPVYKMAIKGNIKMGFAYGFSQFMTFASISAMFWGGGFFMKQYENLQAGDVFAALFAIMFGAMHMGEAAAFGPDMGKA